MNAFKQSMYAAAAVGLFTLSSAAQADKIDGIMKYYQANSNNSGCTVEIGGIELAAHNGSADLLREAFFRKMVVTVTYTPTLNGYGVPTGSVTGVLILADELP